MIESKDDEFIAWILEEDAKQRHRERLKKEEDKKFNLYYKKKYMEAYKAMKNAPDDLEAAHGYWVAFTRMYMYVK